MILAIFLVFGIIVSRMMAKRIQAEEKISQQNVSAISFFTISKKECLWRSLQENIPDPESISHI
jgi:hypothetical protein